MSDYNKCLCCGVDDMEVERLKSELDQVVMQLVACSLAATQDTEESRTVRLDRSHTYYSDSYAQVCRVVDRYMESRAEVARLKEIIFVILKNDPLNIEEAKQIIIDRGCGGQKIEGVDGTDYDCKHGYSWDCSECPVRKGAKHEH